MRLVDIDAIDRWCDDGYDLYVFSHDLEAMPIIDAVPVVHGEWIELDDGLVAGACSVCGWEAYYYEDDVAGMPYCPNCGAKMDGERKDDKTESTKEETHDNN